MKKFTSIILTVITMTTITVGAYAGTKYTYVTPKAPKITPSLKPCIEKYRAGNYTGAMIDLEQLVKKEKTNTYAKYYLALCYTKLGYENDAKTVYDEIIKKDADESLTYYSKKALACINDPKSEECKPLQPPKENSGDDKVVGDDDMSAFINSGQKIHPYAMDVITKERMEIKLQKDEYERKKQSGAGPLSYLPPTNEEIASALNTLSKIGLNPFDQNYTLSNMNYDSDYFYTFPLNYRNNPSIDQMFLYSQLNQQKNNFINYGI